MKICFFTENYYKGGLDTFLINLINAWPDAKDELTLVCNGTHSGLDTIVEKTNRPLKISRYYRVFTGAIAHGQCDLKWSQSFSVRIFLGLARRLFQYPILFPWYVFSLVFFFRRSDYDRLMVVNGGYPASLLCRCATIAWKLSGKRPLAVFNFHSLAAKSPFIVRWLENAIDLAVVKSTSHVVSVSKVALDSVENRKHFSGLVNKKFIYNGISDPAKHLTINKAKNSVGNYCLMLATYHAYKGHSYLFLAFQEVLKEFPDMQLWIYGFGTTHDIEIVEEELMRLNLKSNVILHGFVSNPSNLISNARMLVVPSQAFESFGLTIIEAMALSTPVVATDVGGVPEVLAGTNAGYICSKSDPLTFADAMKRILRDSDLAIKLGENGRKAFQLRFDASKMAQQYEALFK